jgi:hypothetical protein
MQPTQHTSALLLLCFAAGLLSSVEAEFVAGA